MTNALTDTIYTETMLTEKGWQTVASIVADMQADGMLRIRIDRWIQGLETSRRTRARIQKKAA